MRSEMQNTDTRELTAEELDVVSGGAGLLSWVVGAAGGVFWASDMVDAERRAADSNHK